MNEVNENDFKQQIKREFILHMKLKKPNYIKICRRKTIQ